MIDSIGSEDLLFIGFPGRLGPPLTFSLYSRASIAPKLVFYISYLFRLGHVRPVDMNCLSRAELKDDVVWYHSPGP